MITVQHMRGPSRGVTTERIPEHIALFIVMNGGVDVIECDLALRLWRFRHKHGRGMTIQEVRNSIKGRIPAECDDVTAHTAKLISNISRMGLEVTTTTIRTRPQGKPRVEFSV
jgi:hypothetical protein